jgi:two-component system, NtrC family, response regulator AtoC
MALKHNILIVDSDENNCKNIAALLIENGFSAEWCTKTRTALNRARKTSFKLIVSELDLPDISGLDLLLTVKQLFPETGFLVMTSRGCIETAVKALKEGALEYITKPIDKDFFLTSINQALENLKLKRDTTKSRREALGKYDSKTLLGNSPQMIEIYRTVAQISDSSANVLIVGETGTGKELVARAIHLNSSRYDQPFITINCTSIPETLLESELFGHVKGAFTGAIANKTGLFEEATGGTVLLDEIGDISPAMQVKLLRVLQEKEIRKVGDNKPVPVNVRILAATNRNLEEEVAKGNFREDLFYRLSVVTIGVPPLRDRKDEISFLAYHFLDVYTRAENPVVEDISNDAMEILEKYTWPGNVRELENVIERAVIICRGNQITPAELPERITCTVPMEPQPVPSAPFDFSFKAGDRVLSFSEVEKAYLLFVINETQGDKTKAAKMMGVGRRTLYRMMERHGVNYQK